MPAGGVARGAHPLTRLQEALAGDARLRNTRAPEGAGLPEEAGPRGARPAEEADPGRDRRKRRGLEAGREGRDSLGAGPEEGGAAGGGA